MSTRTLEWVRSSLSDAGRLRREALFGMESSEWHGATIDTRAECSRRIFFALKGEQSDGHRFVTEARSKGSCAIVVESEEAAQSLARVDAPYFVVDNSLGALQDLARAYRTTLDARVIAITGSAGKTTTKEYVYRILKTKYRVHANPGNYNNHIGVPLTVLETDIDNEYLVSEVGANHPGEIEFLTRLILPDIGVVTNIGDAHIGLFGSRDRIAESKSELIAGVDPDGLAVLPREDDYYELLHSRARCRVLTFGASSDCNCKVSDVEERGDHIDFRINEEPISIESYGMYNVLNACAAFAVAEACGVDVMRIRSALAEAEPFSRRAQVHRVAGMIIIDDSYNANPTSMRAALDGLARFPGRRHVAVLGDMAELGDYSDAAHRDLGGYIGEAPVEVVFWLGDAGDLVAEGLRKSGANRRFESAVSFDELMDLLTQELKAGDVVLLKASRSIALDRVADRLIDGTVKENG